MGSPARGSKVHLGVTVACAGVLIAAVAVSVLEVARPSSATLPQGGVDAVMVHAANERRLDAALALVNAETADTLVLSKTPRSDYGRSPAAMTRLCAKREPNIVCVAPQPTNTLGEARAFGRLAADRGWQRVAVITSRGHLARAALSVRQCTDAEVVAIPANPRGQPNMRRVRNEWLRATATTSLVRAC